MSEPYQPSSPENFPSSPRVFLSAPSAECEQEFLAATLRSEGLHQPWVFPPRTHEQYASYLQKIAIGRTIGFLLRRVDDRQLAGVINVSEPVMGALRSAYLGFYAFAGLERRGYMTEGLALVLDRVFNERGEVSVPKVIGQLVRRPGRLPGLLRLANESERAASTLAHFLDAYLQKIASGPSPELAKAEALAI